ncbi:MAG: M28 family peptidase [Planctomycetia bacterium]|nr:M28 family peptidase [Planctomycetia bacterium]
MKKIKLMVLFSIFLAGGILIMTSVQCAQNSRLKKSVVQETPLEKIPFNGTQAHKYIEELCMIGPRPSGSEGMRKQQAYLEAHFKKYGATVLYQRFNYRHPENGTPVPCANMIIRWEPERKERLLLAAHYDTLPLALLDHPAPKAPFLGANDGGSGVAVLMEMAKEIPEILKNHQQKYGVDFVMLDAEEFMFRPHGRFCVGSEYFARQYAATDPKVAKKNKVTAREFSYRWAVLLDMVGDVDLEIKKERNSWKWRDSRPLLDEIWGIAEELGVKEFSSKVTQNPILDDHVMLHNVGKIPTIDIIDMEYVWWHTSQDTADKCSPLKLARVGWVVTEWVKRVK